MRKQTLKAAIAFASLGLIANTANAASISTKGGLKITSDDKQYSAQIGGRIMYDYNRAELNGVADEDQFDVRRGRLYVKGAVGGDWSYKAQFNITGGSSGGSPEDLYIRYNGFDNLAVTVGRQKMPFGLEQMTSSKDISMLERSALTKAYFVGRADGVVVSGGSGDFTYAVAAYGEDSAADPNLEDFGYSARATFAPINDGDSVVHLGLAHRGMEGGINVTGLELAGAFGAFHAQAEFFDAETDVLDTDGYYFQAGYVLTGEKRPYNGGKFKRIKPQDGCAIELVARYEDGEGDFGDIELGEDDATAWGLGVNVYVNNAVKLGLNYTDGESETSSDKGKEYRARFQLTF